MGPQTAVGLLVLACLLTTLVFAVRRRTAAAAWLLLSFSALWFAADQPLEGPVLYVYSRSRGLTLADLLSAVGALVALTVLVRGAARGRAGTDRLWNTVTVLALGWTLLASGVLLDLAVR